MVLGSEKKNCHQYNLLVVRSDYGESNDDETRMAEKFPSWALIKTAHNLPSKKA